MKKTILFFLIISNINLMAQSNDYADIKIIKNYLNIGQVINNYIYMDSFPKRGVAVFEELYIGKQTRGQEEWHEAYGYPQIGTSLFFSYLGNNRQLGYNFGIIPQMSFRTTNKGKWKYKISVGFGLAYFNKPFDSILNPYNILIGSHITNMSIASLYFERKLNKKLYAEFGLSYIHCSNAHYQIPNAGLNSANLKIGLSYYFSDNMKVKHYEKKTKPYDKPLLTLRAGIGIHEFANTTAPVGTPKWYIYNGIIYLSKRFDRISNVHAGISVRFYTDFYNYIKQNNMYGNLKKQKAFVGTFFLGYEALIKHVSFVSQAGLDLYNPFYKDYAEIQNRKKNFFYYAEMLTSTRLGLQYYIKNTFKTTKNNIFIGIYVNANFGKADFLEFATGYTF